MAQAVADVRLLATLPPECFWPRPDVTSTMVGITRLTTPLTARPRSLADFCQSLFEKRRKQLGAVLGVTGPDGGRPDRPGRGTPRGDPGCTPQRGNAPLTRAVQLGRWPAQDFAAHLRSQRPRGRPLSRRIPRRDGGPPERHRVVPRPDPAGRSRHRPLHLEPGGRVPPVVVKFPLSETEYRWTTSLGGVEPDHWHDRWALVIPTPRIIAWGDHLGGYPIRWIVEERLDDGLKADHVTEGDIEDLLRAAADFRMPPRSSSPPSNRARTGRTGSARIETARALARSESIPNAHAWADVLRRVHRCLPLLIHRWESRPSTPGATATCTRATACDAVFPRSSPDPNLVNRHGRVLIDLGMVHTGHWAEDAPSTSNASTGATVRCSGASSPSRSFARLRRERGLPADDSYGDTALVKRVLTASCTAALLDREGNQKYLAAALKVVSRHLPQVSK